MARMVRSRACWAKTVSLSKGLAQRRFDPSEHCQHHRNGLGGSLAGEPSRKCHARFAFMENEHWPCTLANDEVTLPMAALGSGVDLLGPFVDGDAIPQTALNSLIFSPIDRAKPQFWQRAIHCSWHCIW